MSLADRMRPWLDQVETAMADEVGRWPWPAGPLRDIVTAQVTRGGKHLRPLVAFAFAESAGADLSGAVGPAAAVELYHRASLVLDDVQDHAVVRRDRPSVYASVGPGAAITVAAVLRSLSYHPLNRSSLDASVRAALHQEVDEAATRLVLGQSIDIGWNAGWYPSYQEFPYEEMVRGKTGSLFGCAAAMGSLLGGGDARSARSAGADFGALYQVVDDFRDVFGPAPRFEDFRGFKLGAPLVRLLGVVPAAGVLARLATGGSDWGWLLSLMDEYGVEAALRADIADRAARITEPCLQELIAMIAP